MAARATYRVNADMWTVLRDILAAGEEFNPDSANLRGRKERQPMLGRMQDTINRDTMQWYWERGMIDYVVYSYNTPIAYRINTIHDESVWFSLDEKYSVTTSKHTGKVHTAISQIGL